ncbi:hypothetical protein E2C01_005097 [Portunus trituberculatus]|uniref:Uncharacterized protein n=1 Tax=Portunus trituberculatus TaxID=210409 RepID=A0A5B7CVQ5_PORTR|nr:hypothetical protein [Portunus trituberculatus]
MEFLNSGEIFPSYIKKKEKKIQEGSGRTGQDERSCYTAPAHQLLEVRSSSKESSKSSTVDRGRCWRFPSQLGLECDKYASQWGRQPK